MMFTNKFHMTRFNAWMTLYTILRVIGLAIYLPVLYLEPLILILFLPSYIALTLQLMGWCQKNLVRFERGCKLESVLVRVLVFLTIIALRWFSAYPNSNRDLVNVLFLFHPAILWFLLCQAYDCKDTVEWKEAEDKDTTTRDADTHADQSMSDAPSEAAMAPDASLTATESNAEMPDSPPSSYLYPLMDCKVFMLMLAIMIMESNPMIALVFIVSQLGGMWLINKKRPEVITLAQYVEVLNIILVFLWLTSAEGPVAILLHMVIPTIGLSLILPMLLPCLPLILLEKYKKELME